LESLGEPKISTNKPEDAERAESHKHHDEEHNAENAIIDEIFIGCNCVSAQTCQCDDAQFANSSDDL
jgi:hypothetical protein